MNANVLFLVIGGFFLLVVGLIAYSALVVQPRQRRQLEAEAQERGWTYTPSESIMVTERIGSGYLISPQETVSERFEGTTEGIKWRLEKVTVTPPAETYDSPRLQRRAKADARRRATQHLVWHTEDARIDHGSVLVFVEFGGWGKQETLGDTLRAGMMAIQTELVFRFMRDNWGIQTMSVKYEDEAFEAKYRVEVSDVPAGRAALPPEVRHFLTHHQPPTTPLHIGDNGIHLVGNVVALQKFEQIGAMVEFGAQLAQVVRANVSVTPSTADSGTDDAATAASAAL
jgi:hypothetical protein